MALGNTASDLIGNLVSFKASHSASLALGELLGAGLFLNCVVAGVINIMGSAQQISLRPSTALRTLTFFGAGLAMVIVIISTSLANNPDSRLVTMSQFYRSEFALYLGGNLLLGLLCVICRCSADDGL